MTWHFDYCPSTTPVLMASHFNYDPRWCSGNNQSVTSSAPVVSRWLGNRTFLEVASMVVTWWIVTFLRSDSSRVKNNLITYFARGLYVWASAQQDLRAGDGDSFNNSMLSLHNHSIQSSLLTRRVAIHAYKQRRKMLWFEYVTLKYWCSYTIGLHIKKNKKKNKKKNTHTH